MTRTKQRTYEIEIGEGLYRVDVTITGHKTPARFDYFGSGWDSDESKEWEVDSIVYINEFGEEYKNDLFDELEAEIESRVDNEVIDYYD